MNDFIPFIQYFPCPAALIDKNGKILSSNKYLEKFFQKKLKNENITDVLGNSFSVSTGLHKVELEDKIVSILIASIGHNKFFFMIFFDLYLHEQACNHVKEYLWVVDQEERELYQNRRLQESPYKEDILEPPKDSDIKHIKKDGKELFLEYSSTPLYSPHRKPIGVIHSARDIAPLIKSQSNLQLLKKILDSIDIGIVFTDMDGKIIFVNNYIVELFHVSERDLKGKLIYEFLDESLHETIKKRFKENSTEPIHLQLKYKNNKYWINANGKNIEIDGIKYRIVTIYDITEFKNIDQKLNFLIQYDPLTALYNRSYTIKAIEKKLSKLASYGAILYLDIDNFKEINEFYSHSFADKLLLELSLRLKRFCDHKNIIGRIGGDEFLIFLDLDHQDRRYIEERVRKIAKVLHHKLIKPYRIDGKVVKISLSMAISIVDSSLDIDTLLKQVESTIAHAKRKKENLILFFDQKYLEHIKERMRIRDQLLLAIKNKEFKLAYQAQVVLEKGEAKVVGYEALLRWIKDGEIVPPDKFIPIAEESGLIVDIGLFVIDEVCKVLENRQDDLHISVNISPKQFEDKDFVKKSLEIINRYNFDNSRLIFEITETMLLHDMQDAMRKIKEITQNNISFSIDDFGTGYSSFEYLKKLPLSELKIDRSFIINISVNTTDQVITKAIIDIGHLFGMKVVAEGVETKDQVELLQQYGADIFQGYYFAKPTFEI